MWLLLLFLLSLPCARTINQILRTNTPVLLSKSIDYRAVDMTPLYTTWGINHGLPAAPQFRWPWYILCNIHEFRHDLYSSYKQILCHKYRNIRAQSRQCWGNWLSPNTVIKLLLGVAQLRFLFRSRSRRICWNVLTIICFGRMLYSWPTPCQCQIKLRIMLASCMGQRNW